MALIWQVDSLFLCKTGLEARAPISTNAQRLVLLTSQIKKQSCLQIYSTAVTEIHMGAAGIKSAFRSVKMIRNTIAIAIREP